MNASVGTTSGQRSWPSERVARPAPVDLSADAAGLWAFHPGLRHGREGGADRRSGTGSAPAAGGGARPAIVGSGEATGRPARAVVIGLGAAAAVGVLAWFAILRGDSAGRGAS